MPVIKRINIDITKRLHGIDALRGIAMLLGVLLHATIAYKTNPLPSWPHDKAFHYGAFDYLYMLIHSFRMPLFFLIAGYFCRFLVRKIGERAFIQHRIKRILIPFVVSMIVILPFTTFPFLVYQQSLHEGYSWSEIFRHASRQLFQWNGMAHLWFLYYLLIYYVTMLVCMRLGNSRGIRNFIAEAGRRAGRLYPGPYIVLLLATVPVWLILNMGPEILLHVSTGILPSPAYLLFFGYFFLAGWWINRSTGNVFTWMAGNTRPLIIVGLAISGIVFWMDFSGYYHGAATPIKWMIKFFAAVQISFLVAGSIGLFLRTFQAESPLWKYIADASYWIYLVHLGIVAGLQVLFMHIGLPGWLRFPSILLIALAVSLITYHYFVRFTILGKYLHGERKQKQAGRRIAAAKA